MVDLFKKFFGEASKEPGPGGTAAPPHDIRVATCALLLEMANIDGEFSDAERDHLVAILGKEYGLSDAYAVELTSLARKELDGSIDLWRFTNLINQNYSKEERVQVVELMWGLVYADGRLDEHENYLVHKLGKMLRLNHRELIDAKLTVLHEKGESS